MTYYKNMTIAEAFESLDEAVADLVYFKVDPALIHDAVDAEIERATEREDAGK